MTKELEHKDIACYASHKLEMAVKDPLAYLRPRVYLVALHFDCNRCDVAVEDFNFDYKYKRVSDFKPLLNPMSAMTKPMVVKGYNNDKEFVPIIELGLSQRMYASIDGKKRYLKFTPDHIIVCILFEKYQKEGYERFIILTPGRIQLLAQWHFDYNDLIGQGLALDKTIVRNGILSKELRQ